MDLRRDGPRQILRAALGTAGVLGVVRRSRRGLRNLIRYFRHPEVRRRRRADRQRFEQFKEHYGNALEGSLATANDAEKTVLFVSRIFRHMELQLVLLNALALAGYRPVVLIVSPPGRLRDCYRWAGVATVRDWSRYVEGLDFSAAAEAAVAKCASVDELLGFEHAGSRCGKNAASTALRQLRTGTLDLHSPRARQVLVSQLASAMASATAAATILRQFRPDLMLCFDAEYTPGVELFDNCMEHGVDVVTYREGHKNDTLILKRYSRRNRDQNPVSLSDESWETVRTMPWSEARGTALRKELHDDYASGNWYGVAGTQFNTRIEDAGAVRSRLGIPPDRKTAFIFPHIPWDAAFRWGRDLFGNYEEWLIATVRAACLNDKVNWVIKIHPANIGKLLKGKYQEPAETVALRERLGELPPHVCLILPDSDISTYSLFPLMDYCVTVRGTIGIEAATLGIPVITAGTGRYEGRGFTFDPATREEYLDRIARIQEIAPLSPAARELAERYAYGIFMLRPFPVRAISLEFSDHSGAEAGFTKARINIAEKDGWRHASDLQALARWINDSRNPDFLVDGGQASA